jgi:hypothetical protein
MCIHALSTVQKMCSAAVISPMFKDLPMRHLLIVLVLLFTANLMSQNYQAEKNKIEAAMKDGKPRTALKAAEAYYDLAIKNGNEDQAIKALAYRAELTSQTEEEGQDAAINLIHQELDTTKDRPVVAAVLNFMLGSSYYQYAQQNSWRLRNNTAVTTDSVPAANRPLEDWNLTQLVKAAEDHLFKGLDFARAARTQLFSVPAIVTNDSARIDEQPTLYDLLARASLNMRQRRRLRRHADRCKRRNGHLPQTKNLPRPHQLPPRSPLSRLNGRGHRPAGIRKATRDGQGR